MEPADETLASVAAPPPPRAIPMAARALVFFNDRAGSVGPEDRQRLVEQLAQSEIGQYALIDARKISRSLFERAGDFDVIIVLGGDGTARAAAELAPRDGPPLVLLPGGTLNILPKALYGERAWPEALKAALERGVVKRLPVGRANGSTFFVAAMFGGPTLLARAREALRQGKLRTAWRRFILAARRLFSNNVRARCEGGQMRKSAAVGVLCPSFSGGIEAQQAEWVRLDAHHILDLARVSVRALTADWRNDPAVEVSQCRDGDIVSLGLIPATLDGEPRTFVSRVHVSFEETGPRVLALEGLEGEA